MTAPGRDKPKLFGDYLSIGAPAALVALLGLWVAFFFVEPAPPTRIAIASGEPGGAYALYAERYREELARHGVELVVKHTAGSSENLSLLHAEEVDVAFVQGGVTQPGGAELLSLGSLFFEPLWIFQRGLPGLDRLSDLRGARLSAGPEGSGTRAVALELLESNGVEGAILALSSDAAVAALGAGELDAAFFIASPDSGVIRALLADPSIALVSLARAHAYARLHQFLSQLTLPEGVIDLAANVPPRDISLVSPTANLVIGADFHPALVDLLLQAAARVHRDGDVFSQPGAFPTQQYLDLPLSPEAERFYKHGPPFLQRYLPFWLATLVDRLKVMLIPLVALLLPLIRVLPPMYRWRVRSRIYRWYTELATTDPYGNRAESPGALDAAIKEVDRIAAEVGEVAAPASYGRELYDLRVHIGFVRDQLDKRRREFESG